MLRSAGPEVSLQPGSELALHRRGEINPTRFAGRDPHRASVLSLHFQGDRLRARGGCENFAHCPQFLRSDSRLEAQS